MTDQVNLNGKDMTSLNTSLSPSQAKYALWIEEKLSFLLPLFDFENRSYKSDEVERFLGVASHGEAIMARFALGIWRHDDQFDFDFIDAAQTLDDKYMNIVTNWLQNPFWP